MPERTTYEPGTPSWVDLGTTDPDAAKRFYGELFGWQAEDAGPVEETGGYAMFMHTGKRVAGVGPRQGDAPSAWTTYVSTDDLDALAGRAKDAGANALMEPMDVMDAGRLAVFMHEAAGVIGAWQPGSHFGAEIVNEPGSFTWCECQTRDVEGAKAFGEAVFGWRAETSDFAGGTYTIVYVGDRGVGGIVAMPDGVPVAVPSYWLTYFAVDDCDATVAKVTEMGGLVTLPPIDAEGVGRLAVVADPQGAAFGVIKNAQPTT
jgi:predicted enzyme related to lactoylglutathione lyase